MQILPSKELMPFIKHYLFLESESKSIKKLRLFSDGNMGMVFSLKNSLICTIQNNKLSAYLPASFVYGQISKFKDLLLINEASLIIVVFQPAGINQLMGLSAAELKDNIIRTEELFGCKVISLQEKLFEQISLKDKVEKLNAFFIELTAKKVFVNQLLIGASVDFILKNRGTNSISQLVKYTSYSERHLERIFIECIGLSPKKFGNIVKLHSFLKLLKDKSKQNNITNFCYEAGYADQSHLIKEFKKYTGITPTQYLTNTSRLAINFMEFTSTEIPMSDLYNLQIN
jgi:AraC-like DNA-binding protein